jgi:hypothetical protein
MVAFLTKNHPNIACNSDLSPAADDPFLATKSTCKKYQNIRMCIDKKKLPVVEQRTRAHEIWIRENTT